MKPAQAAKRLLAAAAILTLASCIDGHEECWIHPDGGGRAVIRYSLPDPALRAAGGSEGVERMIQRLVEHTPTIRKATHEVATANGRTTVTVRAEFDSVLDLARSTATDKTKSMPAAITNLAGEVHTRFQGLAVDVTRRSEPGKAIPLATLLPASNFEGRRLVTILHLPVPAARSNADRTHDGGHTLVWDTPLADAIRRPRVMELHITPPTSWIWLAGLCSTAAALVGVAWVRRLRTNRRQRAASRALSDPPHPAP
jgi:hypothetical protein